MYHQLIAFHSMLIPMFVLPIILAKLDLVHAVSETGHMTLHSVVQL